MTPAEARDFMGLPADVKLNDQGEQIITCLADVPAPVPGDDDSFFRSFGLFLEACDRAGVRPPFTVGALTAAPTLAPRPPRKPRPRRSP